MGAYWGAVFGHVGSATFDVLFVAFIGLLPLLMGRLLPTSGTTAEDYWAFLSNGQLAFFSMGSLATLLLICLRKKLPDQATLWVGLFSLICLLFLMVLVGFDPSLQNGAVFVGRAAFWLYIVVLAVRILAEAMKAVLASDALDAGTNKSKKLEQQLRSRKTEGRSQ